MTYFAVLMIPDSNLLFCRLISYCDYWLECTFCPSPLVVTPSDTHGISSFSDDGVTEGQEDESGEHDDNDEDEEEDTLTTAHVNNHSFREHYLWCF